MEPKRYFILPVPHAFCSRELACFDLLNSRKTAFLSQSYARVRDAKYCVIPVPFALQAGSSTTETESDVVAVFHDLISYCVSSKSLQLNTSFQSSFEPANRHRFFKKFLQDLREQLRLHCKVTKTRDGCDHDQSAANGCSDGDTSEDFKKIISIACGNNLCTTDNKCCMRIVEDVRLAYSRRQQYDIKGDGSVKVEDISTNNVGYNALYGILTLAQRASFIEREVLQGVNNCQRSIIFHEVMLCVLNLPSTYLVNVDSVHFYETFGKLSSSLSLSGNSNSYRMHPFNECSAGVDTWTYFNDSLTAANATSEESSNIVVDDKNATEISDASETDYPSESECEDEDTVDLGTGEQQADETGSDLFRYNSSVVGNDLVDRLFAQLEEEGNADLIDVYKVYHDQIFIPHTQRFDLVNSLRLGQGQYAHTTVSKTYNCVLMEVSTDEMQSYFHDVFRKMSNEYFVQVEFSFILEMPGNVGRFRFFGAGNNTKLFSYPKRVTNAHQLDLYKQSLTVANVEQRLNASHDQSGWILRRYCQMLIICYISDSPLNLVNHVGTDLTKLNLPDDSDWINRKLGKRQSYTRAGTYYTPDSHISSNQALETLSSHYAIRAGLGYYGSNYLCLFRVLASYSISKRYALGLTTVMPQYLQQKDSNASAIEYKKRYQEIKKNYQNEVERVSLLLWAEYQRSKNKPVDFAELEDFRGVPTYEFASIEALFSINIVVFTLDIVAEQKNGRLARYISGGENRYSDTVFVDLQKNHISRIREDNMGAYCHKWRCGTCTQVFVSVENLSHHQQKGCSNFGRFVCRRNMFDMRYSLSSLMLPLEMKNYCESDKMFITLHVEGTYETYGVRQQLPPSSFDYKECCATATNALTPTCVAVATNIVWQVKPVVFLRLSNENCTQLFYRVFIYIHALAVIHRIRRRVLLLPVLENYRSEFVRNCKSICEAYATDNNNNEKQRETKLRSERMFFIKKRMRLLSLLKRVPVYFCSNPTFSVYLLRGSIISVLHYFDEAAPRLVVKDRQMLQIESKNLLIYDLVNFVNASDRRQTTVLHAALGSGIADTFYSCFPTNYIKSYDDLFDIPLHDGDIRNWPQQMSSETTLESPAPVNDERIKRFVRNAIHEYGAKTYAHMLVLHTVRMAEHWANTLRCFIKFATILKTPFLGQCLSLPHFAKRNLLAQNEMHRKFCMFSGDNGKDLYLSLRSKVCGGIIDVMHRYQEAKTSRIPLHALDMPSEAPNEIRKSCQRVVRIDFNMAYPYAMSCDMPGGSLLRRKKEHNYRAVAAAGFSPVASGYLDFYERYTCDQNGWRLEREKTIVRRQPYRVIRVDAICYKSPTSREIKDAVVIEVCECETHHHNCYNHWMKFPAGSDPTANCTIDAVHGDAHLSSRCEKAQWFKTRDEMLKELGYKSPTYVFECDIYQAAETNDCLRECLDHAMKGLRVKGTYTQEEMVDAIMMGQVQGLLYASLTVQDVPKCGVDKYTYEQLQQMKRKILEGKLSIVDECVPNVLRETVWIEHMLSMPLFQRRASVARSDATEVPTVQNDHNTVTYLSLNGDNVLLTTAHFRWLVHAFNVQVVSLDEVIQATQMGNNLKQKDMSVEYFPQSMEDWNSPQCSTSFVQFVYRLYRLRQQFTNTANDITKQDTQECYTATAWSNLCKLMLNSAFGTLLSKRSERASAFVARAAETRASMRSNRFNGANHLYADYYECSMRPQSIVIDTAVHAGICILDYSRMMLNIFVHGIIFGFLTPGAYVLCSVDTDEIVLSIAGNTLDECVKPSLRKMWKDVVKPAWFATGNDKTPGKVRVTTTCLGVCALSARRMALRTDAEEIVRHSGISNVESNRHALTFRNFVKVLFNDKDRVANVFVQRQRAHGTEHQHMQVYQDMQRLQAPVCLWKRVLRTDNVSTLPLYYSVKLGVLPRRSVQQPPQEQAEQQHGYV